MKNYYFDIGSSTIKLYKFVTELEQIEEKSILFKKNFTPKGISNEDIYELMNFIKLVKDKYSLNIENTEVYATGIWRKIPKRTTRRNKRNMMVNMGGKTTELVIFSNNDVEKK